MRRLTAEGAVRISTWMMRRDALRAIGGNLEALARAQRQSVSGRRIETVSDDPAGASQVMRLDAHLRDIEQFRKNAASASTRLSTEDAVLKSARELIDRARGLALSGATASPSDPLRQQALAEMDAIKDQLVALGNTKLGDEFLFGGGQTGNPPFRLDGTYLGDSTVRRATIDQQLTMDTNHTGDVMLGSALAAFDSLVAQLQIGDAESIRQQDTVLASAQQDLLTVQTEVGARLQTIEKSNTYLAGRATMFAERRDTIRDVDPAEAVVEVVARQNALERAYAVIGRVLSTNLVDFLQ
jgi:flagellar hook-associated protein 3 FlgL